MLQYSVLMEIIKHDHNIHDTNKKLTLWKSGIIIEVFKYEIWNQDQFHL